MRKRYWIIGLAVIILIAAGAISVFTGGEDGGDTVAGYQSITMDEAKEIFAEAGDYVILDVRSADEFAEGHIPGAMHLANEEIGAEAPEELPDLDTVIYVYCRSGRRSKEASSKLAALGYTGIVECGGILDWTGDVER